MAYRVTGGGGWMWPIESCPGFVTERQNDSLCLSVIKQILAERRVATRLGALTAHRQ